MLRSAGREGWLDSLVEAHGSACTIEEAQQLLNRLGLPGGTRISFRNKRGWARFNKHKRYHIGLPNVRGARQGRLRRGLVLHEAAHILDHRNSGSFGHQEKFLKIFRRLLASPWRGFMTGNFKEIYDRHRGPYGVMLTRVVEVKNGTEQVSDRLPDRFTAEDAHEEARMLVNDPKENVKSAYVFSESEGQFIGAFYSRGEEYPSWDEMRASDFQALGVEVPAKADEPAPAPPPAAEPAKPVVKLRAQLEPRKVGSALQIAEGREAEWPPSAAAQEVLGAFKADGKMTAKQAAEKLAPKMIELGVAHPASLVSRLKQAGLLTEVKE